MTEDGGRRTEACAAIQARGPAPPYLWQRRRRAGERERKGQPDSHHVPYVWTIASLKAGPSMPAMLNALTV